MTSPWERLREAAIEAVWQGLTGDAEPVRLIPGEPLRARLIRLREALAALPAALPEQPATDTEIDEADGCDGNYKALDHAMQILRRCTAPYSGEQAQAVAKALRQWHDKWATLIDSALGKPPESDAIVTRIAEWTHRHGAELIPPGGWADSFGDGMRCAKTQVQHLMKLDEPVPAPPASDPYGEGVGYKPKPAGDWRERFDEATGRIGIGDYARDALAALRDGLAALEAEVARLRKEKP